MEQNLDHSNLPEIARVLIETAEDQARAIFDACKEDVASLLRQAADGGIDPSGIGLSPGRPALEAAYNMAPECPQLATNYLFKTTALIYWNHVLKPDVTAFMSALQEIWSWAHAKFGLQIVMPEEIKRNWLVWAIEVEEGQISKTSVGPTAKDPTVGNMGSPEPLPALWEDIRLSFFNEHALEITVGQSKRTYQYDELGMADQRTGKPNLAWQTLHALASNGTLNRPTGLTSKWTSVEKRVQELRKWLRDRFGISSDPLPFVPNTGYRHKFRITLARSYKR